MFPHHILRITKQNEEVYCLPYAVKWFVFMPHHFRWIIPLSIYSLLWSAVRMIRLEVTRNRRFILGRSMSICLSIAKHVCMCECWHVNVFSPDKVAVRGKRHCRQTDKTKWFLMWLYLIPFVRTQCSVCISVCKSDTSNSQWDKIL